MFEGIIEGLNYYDFPSFEVAMYSLLLSFVLSTIIAMTYKFTFEGVEFSGSFFQAMVLGSMVVSMVMMSVGNNLAVGFGILGALAIIRFRTRVQNPRNIIFIFAAISVGIATGVYGYAVAIAGTFIFCLVAILLHYSPQREQTFATYLLSFSIPKEQEWNELQLRLMEICSKALLKELRERGDRIRLEFEVSMKKEKSLVDLRAHLHLLEIVTFRIERKVIDEL